MKYFSDFQSTTHFNILCISRVGDVSVNLPSASVVIQVSSQGGSRRQEAQRLGRILRPKDRHADGSVVRPTSIPWSATAQSKLFLLSGVVDS
jgi:DNA excision repair protein ERCC-3